MNALLIHGSKHTWLMFLFFGSELQDKIFISVETVNRELERVMVEWEKMNEVRRIREGEWWGSKLNIIKTATMIFSLENFIFSQILIQSYNTMNILVFLIS